jgi:hypothetical protein
MCPDTMIEHMLLAFGRKILRRFYGPIQDKGRWRCRWSIEIYRPCKDININHDVQLRRVERAGHITGMEDERIQKNKKVFNGKFYSRKTKNKMGGHRPDEYKDGADELGIEEWRRLLREARAQKWL